MANRAAEPHTHRGNGSHHVPRAKAPPAPYGFRAPRFSRTGRWCAIRWGWATMCARRASKLEHHARRHLRFARHVQEAPLADLGPTFYQLHLLFDKHYAEQAELVDKLAERVQTLGGVAIAMAHDIAELSEIERPPRGREDVPVQVSRLLEAHEHILIRSRAAARRADERATTAPTTSMSAISCAPTRCRCGSSRST